MPEAFAGKAASGSYVTYTVPRDHQLQLDLITFTLTCDSTTGVHAPAVTFYDPAIAGTTARLWDWNEGGPSMTLYYTYGRGLRPFNCTVTTGMMIQHDLPETVLAPDTTITLSSLNVTGTVISGDAFSNVVLFGTFLSLVDDTPTQNVTLIPGLLPV